MIPAGAWGNNDFTGKPFYTNALEGVRTFTINEQGQLFGISFKERWLPGQNTAHCHRWTGRNWTTAMNRAGFDPDDSAPAICQNLLECHCGYYGYYPDSSNFPIFSTSDGVFTNVTAIIRAEGRVASGTKGFRAEKATIVALAIPPVILKRHLIPIPDALAYGETINTLNLHGRIREQYPDVPIFLNLQEMLDAYPAHRNGKGQMEQGDDAA